MNFFVFSSYVCLFTFINIDKIRIRISTIEQKLWMSFTNENSCQAELLNLQTQTRVPTTATNHRSYDMRRRYDGSRRRKTFQSNQREKRISNASSAKNNMRFHILLWQHQHQWEDEIITVAYTHGVAAIQLVGEPKISFFNIPLSWISQTVCFQYFTFIHLRFSVGNIINQFFVSDRRINGEHIGLFVIFFFPFHGQYK